MLQTAIAQGLPGGYISSRWSWEEIEAILAGFISNVSRTLYVSSSGSDATGDGTQARPFATIQKAINALPKNLGGTTNTINVAAGNYPGFRIDSFYGGSLSNSQGILIKGDTSGGTVITGGVVVSGCEVPVYLGRLKITGNDIGGNISILRCRDVLVIFCTCTGTSAPNGMRLDSSIVSVYNCEISDKTGYGIISDGSLVFANFITGANNRVCLQCGSSSSGLGGLLIGYGQSIAGTAKYAKEAGGIIFADGVQV